MEAGDRRAAPACYDRSAVVEHLPVPTVWSPLGAWLSGDVALVLVCRGFVCRGLSRSGLTAAKAMSVCLIEVVLFELSFQKTSQKVRRYWGTFIKPRTALGQRAAPLLGDLHKISDGS